MAHILIQKAASIVSHVTQAFDVRVLEWMQRKFVLMEHIAIRQVPWSVYSARQVIGEIKYILCTPDEFGTATVKHNLLPQLPGTLRPIWAAHWLLDLHDLQLNDVWGNPRKYQLTVLLTQQMQSHFGRHILVISLYHSCTRIDILSAPWFAMSALIKHRQCIQLLCGDDHIISGIAC